MSCYVSLRCTERLDQFAEGLIFNVKRTVVSGGVMYLFTLYLIFMRMVMMEASKRNKNV